MLLTDWLTEVKGLTNKILFFFWSSIWRSRRLRRSMEISHFDVKSKISHQFTIHMLYFCPLCRERREEEKLWENSWSLVRMWVLHTFLHSMELDEHSLWNCGIHGHVLDPDIEVANVWGVARLARGGRRWIPMTRLDDGIKFSLNYVKYLSSSCKLWLINDMFVIKSWCQMSGERSLSRLF